MGSRLLREFSQRLPLYMLCLSSFPSNFLLFPRRRLQLSSSEAGEGSDCDLMVPLPISCVYAAPPLVGPASLVGEDDLAEWRSRFSLPSSIVIRVPTPEEHASSYTPGEIAVYEAFFDSGLRGTILALIAGLCNLFEISPSQLNPPAWRILIAIQNLGEGQFHLPPCSGLPIVEELPKSDQKGPAGTHPAPSKGEKAVLRARQLPADRRQVNFLVNETVLRRSSLWRDMLGGVTNDPFAAYQEAVKVMSAKKGSGSRSASGDEEMITGSRRSPVVKLEPSPSLSGKRPKSGGVTTRSAQQSADIARSAGRDSSEVIRVLQGGLLRVVLLPACFPFWFGNLIEIRFVQTVSQLHHLGERLSDEGMLVLREEVKVLKRQVSGEKEQCVAREFEIRDLKEKVKDLEKVAEASSADALTVNQKNKELEEDIEVLKAAAETFKFEMVMAVNGARVVARWELMREWLRKQSAQWDLVTALEQYKAVVQEEARSKGAPLPTFEDEPAIPPSSDMDVDSSVKPRGSPT
ncbi:hypothetical protein DY000_02014976 [Brassica cretica]|uniref:Atg6 BARA domain-containing protein n=1 Tax=Brassica cretica TaxID=69181 RepID=A0ABQ7CYW8_BRACR|nr:hypothetical protein DY000_02014976 [Brassica cretica]